MGKPKSCKDGCPPFQTCDFCAGKTAIDTSYNYASWDEGETQFASMRVLEYMAMLEKALEEISTMKMSMCKNYEDMAQKQQDIARAALGEKKDG
jgi:hypothetical protein